MNSVTENPTILREVFFPFALQKQKDAATTNQKFVYYTSAEVAVSILRNQEIWMRKTNCMNDYSEVEYGLDLLYQAWDSGCGKLLKAQLDALFSGFSDKIEKKFNEWTLAFRLDTYLTCISEHESDTEDDLGRLSMWRAYGGKAGVALVLNNDVLLSATDALSAYASPVAYLDKEQFFSRIEEISENIRNSSTVLKAFEEHAIFDYVFEMLRAAMLCTKHPGFSEEREWRVIYSPIFAPSNVIKKSIETINGIPQLVCKIPLIDIPDQQLNNLELSKFLHHIIIGPTEFPLTIKETFVSLLDAIGVEEPASKVHISNIPLRR